MSHLDIPGEIENLPHYREWECRQCGHEQRSYILAIQSNCERCGARVKLRRYAAGVEIEDIIDAVLMWLGEGEELEQALARKRTLDAAESA